MANMGLYGAIGGAAKGIEKGALMDMEEARETRLKNLGAKHQQETNRLSQEQRTADQTARDAAQQEYSLETLAQGQENTMARDQQKRDWDREDRPDYEIQRDASGNISGQIDQTTGKWESAGTTARGGAYRDSKPADAKMIEFLSQPGDDGQPRMSFEEARDWVKQRGGMSPQDFKRDLVGKIAAYGDVDMDYVDTLVEGVYGQQSGPQSPGDMNAPGDYNTMFDKIKAQSPNASDATIQKYISEKYGITPDG